MTDDRMDNSLWLNIDAPRFAETFDVNGEDGGDSWFGQFVEDILAGSPGSVLKKNVPVISTPAVANPPAMNNSVLEEYFVVDNGATTDDHGGKATPADDQTYRGMSRHDSFEIITPEKEANFSMGSQLPEPIEILQIQQEHDDQKNTTSGPVCYQTPAKTLVTNPPKRFLSPAVGVEMPYKQKQQSNAVLLGSEKRQKVDHIVSAYEKKKPSKGNDLAKKPALPSKNLTKALPKATVRKAASTDALHSQVEKERKARAVCNERKKLSNQDGAVKKTILPPKDLSKAPPKVVLKKAASSGSLAPERKGSAKVETTPRSSRTASSASIKRRPLATEVKPFSFATDKRHDYYAQKATQVEVKKMPLPAKQTANSKKEGHRPSTGTNKANVAKPTRTLTKPVAFRFSTARRAYEREEFNQYIASRRDDYVKAVNQVLCETKASKANAKHTKSRQDAPKAIANKQGVPVKAAAGRMKK